MDIQLRKGNESDLDSIMGIVSEVIPLMHKVGNFQWDTDYPMREDYIKDCENDNCWVAYDVITNVLVGVAALTEDSGDDYKQLWDISEIAVVPHRICVSVSARGLGVTKKFMRQAEVLAKERGHKSVRVDTNKQNGAMQHIFKELDYTNLGELKLASRPALTFIGYDKKV
jgi:GNAT superfamily N-acetyltransferase